MKLLKSTYDDKGHILSRGTLTRDIYEELRNRKVKIHVGNTFFVGILTDYNDDIVHLYSEQHTECNVYILRSHVFAISGEI